MSMQFEYIATVLSVTRVTVEGKTYAAVYVGEEPTEDKANDTQGFSIRKIPADPAVFEQFNNIAMDRPQQRKLLMILKQAAQGKSQPHIIGVAPEKSHTASPSQAKSA